MRIGVAGAFAVLTACSSLTACGGGLPANVSRTDSAGVTIVTNSAARLAEVPTWTLSTNPVERIVTPSDSSYTLLGVRDIVPLPQGQLAVANTASNDVLVFKENATLASRFGRLGDGPGEFRHITSLVPLPGDSLGVYDGSHRTLSVFSVEGAYGRAVQLGDLMTTTGDATGAVQLRSLKRGDLAFVTVPLFGGSSGSGVYRPVSEWLRIDSRGERKASYGSFPGSEVFRADKVSGRPLFGRFTVFATSGRDLVVGTGVTTQLQVRKPSGALSRIVRWPDHDRRVTDARVDSAVEAVASVLPSQKRSRYRATMKEMPHAAQEPPYQRLLASDEGQIWVGGYADETRAQIGTPTPSGLHWLVFTPAGALTAKVSTPEGFEPRTLQGSRLIGVYTDSRGNESVRVYRVVGQEKK